MEDQVLGYRIAKVYIGCASSYREMEIGVNLVDLIIPLNKNEVLYCNFWVLLKCGITMNDRF